MAVEHGIGLVVVDGPDDVDRLEAIVPAGRTQDVLVRIIPGVTADTHAHVLTGHEGSKFGLLAGRRGRADHPHRAQPAAADARACTSHVGSQILDVEPFAEAVAPLAALGEFAIYDLGGGLGARYTWADQPPSVARLPRRADRRGPRAPARRRRQIIIEPGRSMVATSRRRPSTG